MKTKPAIFLSASIPTPGRAPFDQDVQRYEIREAVLGLVTICRDMELRLGFGGHPAISPLVHHAAEALGNLADITIYQSEFFRDRMPAVALAFPGLIFTLAVHDPDQTCRDNLRASVGVMRDQMINTFAGGYLAAVFIGGMDGIEDEFKRFGARYPTAPRLPISSTGGATRLLHLLAQLRPDELPLPAMQLLNEDADEPGGRTYRALFEALLRSITFH